MSSRSITILHCDTCGVEQGCGKLEGQLNDDGSQKYREGGWFGWKTGVAPPIVYGKPAVVGLDRVDWCSILCFTEWWKKHLLARGAREVPEEIE